MTRDGGFVRDGEVPPMTPLPEVITWGSRVFVHCLAHRPEARNLSELPAEYIESMAFSLEVIDGNGTGPRRPAGFRG